MRNVILAISAWLILAVACKKDDNQAPQVILQAPLSGEVFISGDTILVRAQIKDDDLRFVQTSVTVDSNNAQLLQYIDTISFKDVLFSTKILIETEVFADYILRIAAVDKSGNATTVLRPFSVRP
jgi:flagellar basal body-associated protein FliL